MKKNLLFKKRILLLVAIVLSSSCSEPVPVQVKAQNTVKISSLGQTVATCCSKKPNRFATDSTPVKLKK